MELGLVIAALTLAGWVQRDGHDDIGGERFRLARDNFRQTLGEPVSKRGQLLTLQEQNRVTERLIITAKATGRIERVEPATAGEAERLLRLHRHRRDKRTAAALAGGPGQALERFEARGADGNGARGE